MHFSLLSFDIPESTLVWTPYMIFSDFHDIKIYMYYVFKSICITKGTLVVFDFILARWCLEKVFDCLWVLKKRLIHSVITHFCPGIARIKCLVHLLYFIMCLFRVFIIYFCHILFGVLCCIFIMSIVRSH